MPRNRAEVVVISWRDIPAQVNARDGHERHQVLLPARFQRAVERATRVAGRKTSHEHVAEWRRRSFPLDGDALEAARTEADRLDAAFPPDRLRSLIAAGGWDPDSTSPS
jgi:Virulence factor/FAD linked oxidases, C-terminal domain